MYHRVPQTARNLKMAVFWDRALRSLVDTDVLEEPTACIIRVNHSDNRSSKLFRNIGQYLPTKLHGVTSQKTAVFIPVAVKTSYLTGNNLVTGRATISFSRMTMFYIASFLCVTTRSSKQSNTALSELAFKKQLMKSRMLHPDHACGCLLRSGWRK
jgi:hypothetical protein